MSFSGRFSNDERRVRSLHEMHLTEREPEPAITATVEATAEALDCPIASITLIDSEREIFLAAVGVERCSAPREQAFCDHTIRSDEILVVEDARRDPRFSNNPQVTERGICFYAGIALHALDGQRIGALSVRDTRPRACTDRQRRILSRMAVIVESQLLWCVDRWKRVQAQMLLTGVMKSSQDAVLLLEPIRDVEHHVTDFHIRSASSAMARILGFEPDRLRDRSFLSIFGRRMKREDIQRLVQAAVTGRSDQFEYQNLHDGQAVWHLVSVARWRDGLAMTLHDITDYKHIEHSLQEARVALDQQAVLVDNSLDGICKITRDGRMLYINRAGRQLVGLTPDESIPQRPWRFVPEDHKQFCEQVIFRTTLMEGQWSGEFVVRNLKTGRRIPVWISAFVIPTLDGSGTDCLAAIVRDIRREKQTQMKLEQLVTP